jgi:hypothetical protein
MSSIICKRNGVIKVSLGSSKLARRRQPKENGLNSHTAWGEPPYGEAVQSNYGYSAATASRTHETRFEARQREVGTARANQSIDVELLSVNAFPDPLHPVARAVRAPHVHFPAEASRDA